MMRLTRYSTILPLLFLAVAYCQAQDVNIPPISDNRTISIVNNCSFPIYPAFLTTNGTAPYTSGFYLEGKQSRDVWVGWDWVGRLWGRTNCSFSLVNATTGDFIKNVTDNFTIPDGQKLAGGCLTGDCGSAVQCKLSGLAPTTLAEFTITGYQDQTFYDISLVDGYSLDMKITPSWDRPDKRRVDNTPICVASTSLSSPANLQTLHQNNLNESYSFLHIQRWCPHEMLLFESTKGRQSVFPYPDDHDENVRGGWTPCLSACAYTNSDWDCCKGKHDKAETCGPNLYSRRAKEVCGDAYSYAYDDFYSTFAVPSEAGEGFEVMFCPGGESTNILKGSLGKKSAGVVGKSRSVIGVVVVMILGIVIQAIL